MKENLLSDILAYYNKVTSIYKSTGYSESYKLNTFWSQENMKNMRAILNNSSNAQKAIHSVQKTWMFSVNTSKSIKNKAVKWLLNEQLQRGINIFDMPEAIAESQFSFPQNNVLVKKKNLTPDFLRTVSIVHEIKKYCKTKNSRLSVVELGGGCGHLARTVRLFNTDCSYAIVDIPETLCFSYMFLKLNFPKAKTFYVTDEKQLKNSTLSKFDYIFIPTKFTKVLLDSSFDIFVNTASMGEMDNSVIRYWMDFVQKKLKVKYLFTLNRYLNTIKTDGSTDWRLNENECSVRYDASWNILNWELEPPFARCPYVDTVIARYVEIVAEKERAKSLEIRKENADSLLKDVMDEDWIRLEKKNNPVMTCRDNILVNDMTMTGTLFKLWESIRLSPSEENVSLMLKYLDTLNRRQDVEFEETYYYEKLFEKVYVSKKKKKLREVYNLIQERRRYAKSFPELKPSFSQIPFDHPRVVEQGYQGYNIVKYKNQYYAIAQFVGDVDLTTIKIARLKKYIESGKCFIERSLPLVKEKIDNNIPVLMYEDYKGFNVVKFNGRFYAMSQAIGSVNIMSAETEKLTEYCNSEKCFIEDSLKHAMQAVDRQNGKNGDTKKNTAKNN